MDNKSQMEMPPLPTLERVSIADQVFEILRQRILDLALVPGSKISEVEVASQMGVSRQPVRDAFYRLSKLGFLLIRPQRATQVSPISKDAVKRAVFIRTSLECETCRIAAKNMGAPDLAVLEDMIQQQMSAIEIDDKHEFHRLDDLFHKEICDRSGVGFAWEMIQDSKTHMDRVRMLTLDFAMQEAMGGHVAMLKAITSKNEDASALALREHLAHFNVSLGRIKSEHTSWFTEDIE